MNSNAKKQQLKQIITNFALILKADQSFLIPISLPHLPAKAHAKILARSPTERGTISGDDCNISTTVKMFHLTG